MVGGAVALLGTFLPWLRTGDRARSSYDLSEVARRLNVATGGVERAVVTVWPAVPFAVLSAVVLLVMRVSPLARIYAVVVGAYVLSVAVVLWKSPLETTYGLPVTVVGAGLLLIGALLRDQWVRP